jgi:hypothetical protein
MTGLQLSVLARAARTDDVMPGTSLMYEYQFGKMRQVKWLLNRKLIRSRGGRLIATRDGRRVLEHQLSD